MGSEWVRRRGVGGGEEGIGNPAVARAMCRVRRRSEVAPPMGVHYWRVLQLPSGEGVSGGRGRGAGRGLVAVGGPPREESRPFKCRAH